MNVFLVRTFANSYCRILFLFSLVKIIKYLSGVHCTVTYQCSGGKLKDTLWKGKDLEELAESLESEKGDMESSEDEDEDSASIQWEEQQVGLHM